jgi:undecaprenyl diphosphate synthase
MSSGLTVGIIMDGNRRFARERGMDPWDGHRAGADKLREVVDWARERGDIAHLALFAFSTENWNCFDHFFRIHEEKQIFWQSRRAGKISELR